MRREQLRLKWEEEERKLAERTDIHYEDIRFDGKSKKQYSLDLEWCFQVLNLVMKTMSLLDMT